MIPYETKVKIFAIHYGQKINTSLKGTPITARWLQKLEDEELDAQIIVKPLCSISKYDAINYLMHINKWEPDFKLYRIRRDTGLNQPLIKVRRPYREGELKLNEDGYWYWEYFPGVANVRDVDYLRSLGYALPTLGWRVEQLVEEGIFTLL